MSKKIKIVPTLLTHSLAEFKIKLEKVEKQFSLIQIDIMDGKFVKNKTFFELDKIRKLKNYKGTYELHLMVNDPLSVIKKWQNFKKVNKVVFHYEAMGNDQQILDLINYIKKRKIKVGLAINPETKITQIEQFIPKLNLIFLLGVNPGWGGQSLKQSVLNKAKYLRKKHPKLDIELDGGVTIKNIDRIKKSGVNIIAAGTMIFKSNDIKTLIENIK